MDAINVFVFFASALSLIFGLLVYARNRSHPTNRAFLWFAIAVGSWSLSLGIFRSGYEQLELYARLLYITAALIGFTFTVFMRHYEAEDTPSWYWYILVGTPTVAVLGIAAIPGFLVIDVIPRPGQESFIVLNTWPHYTYFAYIVLTGLAGLGLLAQRAYNNTFGARNKYLYIMAATAVPTTAGVISNLLLPSMGIFEYNWVGQVSTFAMVTIMAYGMFRQQIFDARVIATELLLFALCSISLARVVLSQTLNEILFNIVAFVVVVGVSALLSRSVYREVLAKEQIEKLATSLSVANEHLRELDRQKSEFLSIASHQLRTPLAAIRGYASLMIEGSFGPINEKLLVPVRTIFASSTRMADTVEDFLNVSRIEQNRMEYRFKMEDLKALTTQVVTELSIAAKNKNLELTYDDDRSGPYHVMIDASKVHHVVSNLVDNAIKYTPRGSVHVRLERHINNRDVCVYISDTGAGISKETIGTLFDKFVRARNAQDINVTGTGLGLYVAREMMKAHKGSVVAHSDGEGKGSTFVICLPLHMPPTGAAGSTSVTSPRPNSVVG